MWEAWGCQSRAARGRVALGTAVYAKNLVAFDFKQFGKVVMPGHLRLSWGMKTLKLFLLLVHESFEFGWQVIRYALIFVSAFFRQRASLGCSIEEEVKRKNHGELLKSRGNRRLV